MEKVKKLYFIYKTTNLKNGKFYIGKHETLNLNDGYLGSGKVLRNSVYFHGKENFKREILEFCEDSNTLNKRERDIVNEDLLKDPKCLNLVVGGQGGFGFWSEDHRKKFFDVAKKDAKIRGKKGNESFLHLMEDEEFKKNHYTKVSEGVKNYLTVNNKNGIWDGKCHTEKTKGLISISLSKLRKGENNTQFGTCWITNGNENKKIQKENPNIPEGWYKGRFLKKKLD
jgi:hypothetical protein